MPATKRACPKLFKEIHNIGKAERLHNHRKGTGSPGKERNR
ncbi:unknown [Prevotella sp. CAG:1320]|nr:unknown [Prevotella sp. CAG:1320]